MISFSHRLKSLILVLSFFLFMAPGLPHVYAQNGVMMQYFHWYYPGGGLLWNEVAGRTDELAAAGITALWLPPAYKGASQNDVGYGVYDLYDLYDFGEFDQKETISTKYGTKDQYFNAIAAAHRAGIQIYADVVFNHKMGADSTEKVRVVRVAGDNRNHEYGNDIWIQAWTGFDYPKRSDKYSSFKWRWYHFDGTDWAEDLKETEKIYIDMIGHRVEPVITNQDGWGEFSVNSGSVSVWVEQSSLAGEDQKVDVVFTCHNGRTFWGQNVYVVGSIPELGDWDTDKARILDSENHPDWKNTLSHLPPDTYIEWKCIKRDGAGNVEWQPGGNNKFTTPAGGTGITSGSF